MKSKRQQLFKQANREMEKTSKEHIKKVVQANEKKLRERKS